ncbi:hypothetical protein [Salipiger bermudensis]|uniref:hypothetical protein n=1 Tax=Salipiger bermudensis TaxID=344736 RepID=UPI003007FE28
MGKAIIAILCLVIGVVIGGIGALTLGGGAMAGLGIATGLSAGICSTVQAAVEEELLTPEQVDQVLTRAATDMAALTGNTVEGEIVGSSDDCADVLETLRASAS